MPGEKVQIVVVDHKRKKLVDEGGPMSIGMMVTKYPFSAHVLENPDIKGVGETEEEAVEAVKRELLKWSAREPGQTRKVVEVDMAGEMLVRDVMEE